ESLFDQIIERIPAALGGKQARVLDVDTFVVRDPQVSTKGYAFVLSWSGRELTGLGRYLKALGRAFTTYQVAYVDGAGFSARLVRDGKAAGGWDALKSVLAQLAVKSERTYSVDGRVRRQD